MGQGFVGKVAESGQALVIPDFSKEENLQYNFTKKAKLKSLSVIPLLSKDKVMGTITLATKSTILPYYDINTLNTIGNQVGIALENAKLYQSAQDRLNEIQSIQNAQYEILKHINIDDLLDGIIREISKCTPYDMITCLIGTEKTLSLHKIYGDEKQSPEWLNFKFNLNEYTTLKNLTKTKKPSFISNSLKNNNLKPLSILSQYSSHAILPLLRGDNFIGLIIISKKEKNFYSPDQSSFLINISNIASIAIENARLVEEAQNDLRSLASIDKIARAITSTLNLDELFKTIYEQVCKFIKTDAFFINTYDEKSQKITSAFNVDIIDGKTTIIKESIPKEIDSQHLKQVITSKKPELLLRKKDQSIKDNLVPFGSVDKRSASLLFVPLMFGDDVLGVISAQTYEYEAYDNSSLEMLQTIALYAAIATRHAKMYEEIHKRIADLSLIHSVTSKIILALDLTETLNIIVKELSTSLNYNYCNIFLPKKNTKELYIAATYGQPECIIEDLNEKHTFAMDQHPFKEGPAAKCFLEGRTIIVSNVFKDPIYKHWIEIAKQRNFKSIIKVPLKHSDMTYGVIALYKSEFYDFSEHEVKLLESIATQATSIIRIIKLYEELKQFAHAVRSIREGVSITDLNRNIIFVNEGLQKQTGYTYDELIGKSADYYSSEKNPLSLEDQIIEQTKKGGWQGEVINRRKNGEEYIVNLSTSIVKDENDNPVAYLGVSSDITEKKKLLKQLHDSELTYRGIVETAKEVIFRTDINLKFSFLNNAWKLLTQYSIDESINNHLIFYVNDEDRQTATDMFQRCLSGYKINEFETKFVAKDGTIKNATISATTIYDDEGAITGIQGLITDITDRKNLEQQLIHAQKMESIGMLAGGIAHDFNNLLAGVLGYASFIKKQIEPTQNLYKYIDIIEKSAIRASDLTQQLLAFARGGKYQVKPLNLNRIIVETLKLLERSIDKSISIQKDL